LVHSARNSRNGLIDPERASGNSIISLSLRK
jgi:hypothetical protein